MSKEVITAVAIGIGLSASCGFRVFVPMLVARIGNPVFATGEHAAAIGTSLLSLIIPFIVAAILILLIVFIILKFGKRLLKRNSTA